MISLGLDFTKKLQSIDHWDHLKVMANHLNFMAQNIETIHDSLDMDEVSGSRQLLAANTAQVAVYLEIVRMKLSIMDCEWQDVTKEALEYIKNEYSKEETSTNTVFNVDELI